MVVHPGRTRRSRRLGPQRTSLWSRCGDRTHDARRDGGGSAAGDQLVGRRRPARGRERLDRWSRTDVALHPLPAEHGDRCGERPGRGAGGRRRGNGRPVRITGRSGSATADTRRASRWWSRALDSAAADRDRGHSALRGPALSGRIAAAQHPDGGGRGRDLVTLPGHRQRAGWWRVGRSGQGRRQPAGGRGVHVRVDRRDRIGDGPGVQRVAEQTPCPVEHHRR